MHEATTTARTQQALQKAHAERAKMLRNFVRALFRGRDFPLSGYALTGSPR
ncbi:hypothetical protein [Thalassovita sp.]|jgi:hypothetical protein|uniref:hypothetical protein n=1 Tax=Thalassovita sp. TaxID=1979401 RepID=UPI0029DE6876|nr:hypothetical protein [Thalassovita sp.]